MATNGHSNGSSNGNVNDYPQGVGLDRKFNTMAPNTKDYNDPNNRITTDYGVKQHTTDDWLKVVSEDHTGPFLLEDQAGREKIHRFDHERIPERIVHARGAGAFGTFKLHTSLEEFTNAGVLTDTSRTTPVFTRFSTVQGPRGSADTVRDGRGFAVKFYTEEGNWDIVGNNIPVFFIQDAIKFTDLVHSVKMEPHNEVPTGQSAHNNFWDFAYLHSEATHMYTWTMSDRGIPRSYRMMQGFGVNTFTLINAKGERVFVKFHWTPHLGVHSCVWDEALKIAGQDPDFHRKDLEAAIQAGSFPKWDFGVQILREDQANDFEFDILDATKLWPEDRVPVKNVGVLELNRMPDEYFTQVEQVAFNTSHVVPGIGFSDDPLLQGRNFSYLDTQLSRLGINFQELPVNKAVCPVMNNNRDGKSRHTITKGTVNYWPNRFEATPPAKPSEGAYYDYPAKVVGMKQRLRSPKFQEHYNQAQLFYNSLSPAEQSHMAAAFSFELDHCDDPIVYERMSQRLADIDLTLAQTVAEMVGGTIPQKAGRQNHGKSTINLSQNDFVPKTPTIETRNVAILIADGYDAKAYNGIIEALKSCKAIPITIAPRRSPIFAAGEDKSSAKGVTPGHHLEGARSTLFDSVFVCGGEQSVATLRKSGRAVHWIREAFGHLKAIGAVGEGVDLVRDACGIEGIKLSSSDDVVNSYGVVTASKVGESTFGNFSMTKDATDFLGAYTYAISMHKNFARETDGLSVMVAY